MRNDTPLKPALERLTRLVSNAYAAFRRSNAATGGETEMSLNRVLIALVLMPYAMSDARFLIDRHNFGTTMLLSFLVGTAVLFILVLRAKKPNAVRRTCAMVMDLGMLTLAMYAGGQFVAITFPIYLWVIFGNGFRFGIKYLVMSCLLSVAGFSLVLTTPYWQEQAQLGWGLLACLIIVPIYAAKLIRDLSRAKRAAEAASQAKTQFLTAVSHELRTPLNAIIGMGEMLKDTKLDQDQREMTVTIKSSAQSLLSLIDGILDFSRIEAGELDIKHGVFSVDELFRETAQIVGGQARARNLRFCRFISPEVEDMLVGDHRHLHEVLINLTGNALKFTHSGFVAIRAFQRDTSGSDAHLVIQVADSGIGISEEAQTRIFERFTQADETIVDRFGGTGLGLTIVKQVVEGMGGSINVDSAVGVGSTFTLEIPVKRVASTRAERLVFAEAIYFIVTEHDQIAERLSKGLAQFGIKSRHAQTPSAAIAMLGELTVQGVREAILFIDEQCVHGPIEVLGHAIQSPDRLIDAHLVLLKTTETPLEEVENVYNRCRSLLDLSRAEEDLYRVLQITGARAPQQASEPPSLAERIYQTHKGLSVLVAEDNKTNQRVISKILERGGHHCTIVDNGEEALDAMEEEVFDLALMDLNMPVINGLEAIKLHRLTEHGEGHLPIVALTADATPAATRRALEAGADACATKPIEPDVLLTLIDNTVTELGRRTPETDTVATADKLVSVAAFPSSPSQPGGAIDYTCLDNLANLGGADFVSGVISDYLEDAANLLEEFSTAVQNSDPIAIRDKAHALNSASANIGAQDVAALCQRWETARAPELMAEGDAMVTKLADALEKARAGLHAYALNLGQPEEAAPVQLRK